MVKAADNDIEKITYIKKHQLHGVEMNPTMYALAVANMIFKGDGKANMSNGSCFDLEDMLQNQDYNYTSSILNPPYSQKEKGLKELDFILHSCEMTNKGGKVVAIVPKSVFIDRKNKELKSVLLAKHTVEAVITMPDDLFYPVGTNVAIIVITAKIPHSNAKEVFFYDFKDDGYEMAVRKGRQYINYKEKKKELLLTYKNKKQTSLSAYATIQAEDEWIVESYLSTDYTKLNKDTFISAVASFKAHMFLQDPLKNKMAKLNTPSVVLDTSNWETLKILNIFSFSKLTTPADIKKTTGLINLLGAAKVNNGVVQRVAASDKYKMSEGNVLSLNLQGQGGSGLAYYQQNKFYATSTVGILTPVGFTLTENIGIFLATVLSLLKQNYSFGRGISQERLQKETIKLPMKDGNIDWNFMENYMKEIEGE